MHRFTTKSEAIAAGYVPASARVIEDYCGCRIVSADISGPNEFRYRFAIQVQVPLYTDLHPYGEIDSGHGDYWMANFSDTTFAVSTSVSLSDEINQVNQPGCFSVMYGPTHYAEGIAAAKVAIDRYKTKFPELSHREIARYQGREQAIDAEIARLRAIDTDKPITDLQLARICRNTIAMHHRPASFRIGEFKELLLNGQGTDFIAQYLADSDRLFDRLYHSVGWPEPVAIGNKAS